MAKKYEVEISLAPDPMIEAFKKDVDRSLYRENWKLSYTERVEKMLAALALRDEIRMAGEKLRSRS